MRTINTNFTFFLTGSTQHYSPANLHSNSSPWSEGLPAAMAAGGKRSLCDWHLDCWLKLL